MGGKVFLSESNKFAGLFAGFSESEDLLNISKIFNESTERVLFHLFIKHVDLALNLQVFDYIKIVLC